MTQRTRVFLAANFCAAALVVVAHQLPTRVVGTARYVKPRLVPNPTKAPFLFANVYEGQILSGSLWISCAIFDQKIGFNDLILSVDDVKAGTVRLYPHSHEEMYLSDIALDTMKFRNGPHKLSLSFGEQRLHTHSIRVTFKNNITSLRQQQK
jgi:hypothetical protein